MTISVYIASPTYNCCLIPTDFAVFFLLTIVRYSADNCYLLLVIAVFFLLTIAVYFLHTITVYLFTCFCDISMLLLLSLTCDCYNVHQSSHAARVDITEVVRLGDRIRQIHGRCVRVTYTGMSSLSQLLWTLTQRVSRHYRFLILVCLQHTFTTF